MTELYPLCFAPAFQQRVWGGRRLARWFPDLPPGPIGEAWVLGDHRAGPTRVQNGPLAGETLGALQARFGQALLGRRGTAAKTGGFPLLFKLIDAEDDLSVQVHPGDDDPGLPPGELGKTELWVVLDARPGTRLVYGLADGVTPDSFARALREGRCLEVVRQVQVLPGDVLYVPAGTVHALGRGVLVAEIQQSSDTTYRLYDYDRPGLDGRPRDLHMDDALRVLDFGPPPAPLRPAPAPPGRWVELCRSPHFVVEQGNCQGPWPGRTAPESFAVLLVLDGGGAVAWTEGRERLNAGAAVLLPAALGAYELQGEMRLLRVTVP